MNPAEVEVACWRIWWRLREKLTDTPASLRANCGVRKELYDEAIETLEQTGMITVEEQKIVLQDDRPQMMQVFSTYEGKL